MIQKSLKFDLPTPWKGKRFEIDQVGSVNFVVGPNGSGKSRFATSLLSALGNEARLLGTDRLAGMECKPLTIYGDHLASGLPKDQFPQFKSLGQQGSGIDTLVLLEERLDLRVQVEATLSHLFNRRILLEWNSGRLVARAVLGDGTFLNDSYRLDRDECHGIKELLILLTHLYNSEQKYLIIDEPELNLHPQYQAFFMQEVRRIAGDPAKGRKIIFLVTHSPFILDFRSVDDLLSVISFALDHSPPRQIRAADAHSTERFASLVSRLNVHHKQLFFSDNPVFVEGILDAQLIGAMQNARGMSMAGAGSCIIDAGGCEEVNKYLELCNALGKKAHFVYDLDSLFGGHLRACVADDEAVQCFLRQAGVGSDLQKYCGELETKLRGIIGKIVSEGKPPAPLARLAEFMRGLGDSPTWDKAKWKKARVAIVTALSRERGALVAMTSESDVAEVEGRLNQIVNAFKGKQIGLLPGGTLERYLPAYAGDVYELSEEAKLRAVEDEIVVLGKGMSEAEIATRYGALYTVVSELPSKTGVDVDPTLRGYLGRYIHELQAAIVAHPDWQIALLRAHMASIQQTTARLFSVQEFTRPDKKEQGAGSEFTAVIAVAEMLGKKARQVRVTHLTNSGIGDFKIESV